MAQFKISPVDMEARKRLTFGAGDTVRVWQKIIEYIQEKDKIKQKTRSQAFEGLVLARKHGKEAGATFTVRRIIDTTGVERIFPLYAPTIEKIEILKRAKVRRAKLYHIRQKAAKEVKRQLKQLLTMPKTETVAVEVVTEEKGDKKAKEAVSSK